MENKKNSSMRPVLALLFLALLIAMLAVHFSSKRPIKATDPLSLWTDSAPLKSNLTTFIDKTTTAGSADFIPVEDRVAVFDFDGTLFCETNPIYLDHRILYYRIAEDPEYKDKATSYEKETAKKIKDYMDTGVSDDNLPIDHGTCVASAFSGFTVDEFNSYVKDYINIKEDNYTELKRSEMFYKPMVQVIDYLKDNNFTVYIVSGTDRLLARAFACDALDLPPRQVIGSDELLVATGQDDTDGLDYQYTTDDNVILGGKFLIKNLKMNKVSAIEREIGIKPVLAFGNSSGDYSMATFATSNNKYLSQAYMLCCDDLVRENGDIEKADKMYKKCTEAGWTPISMKDDFVTIYGDTVTYTKPIAQTK